MTASSFPGVVLAIDALHRSAKWVGRTHIQKLLYLAEGWDLLPRQHSFTLYLHGPYSRDLDGQLLALRAAGVVFATPDPAGYGADYSVPDRYAREARRILENTRLESVQRLADTLAAMGVRELEAVSTCEFVRRDGQTGSDEIVRSVTALKPHLNEDEIRRAFEKLIALEEAVASSTK